MKKHAIVTPFPVRAVNVRLDEIISNAPPIARVGVECPECHAVTPALTSFASGEKGTLAAQEILVRCVGNVKRGVRGGKVKDFGPCKAIVTWEQGGLLRASRKSNVFVKQPAVMVTDEMTVYKDGGTRGSGI
jgi:hypothetical protein